MTRGKLLVIVIAAAAVAACSGRPAGDSAPGGAPPPMFTPVGPVPGPQQNPPRRLSPYHEDRAAIVEGRQLFVQFNCSGCHGGRAGGGMGPSLRDVDWLYGRTDAQIFSSINEGRDQGMPAWGTKIPEDQIWKLVAYIQSLRTTNEPQAPE